MDSVEPGLPNSDGGDSVAGVGLANLTGKQIGRYLIGQQLGSGGVATVYRAYDQVQGQTVALKLLLPGADEKTYSRFRREAMTAGALRHPHIVRILQIGIAPKGEVAYIAMELVEGESLSDLLNERGRLRSEETANVLEPIARALDFAHREGVVHRDVKPGNILLRPVSPGAANSVQLEALEYPVVPLLSDFGIARALDAPELTSTGRTVGTPAYMAPEQCAGSREVDGRADVYALGAVIYRCITGRLPFAGTTTQILHAHVYEPLTIDDATLRQLTPLMVEVLQRSMAKRPEDRYATAGELADALALAAGRIPPRPGVTAGESTATLTLSALPAVAAPQEPVSTTVLVPGSASSGTRPANPLVRGATTATTQTATRITPPLQPAVVEDEVPESQGLAAWLEQLNWASVALVAVSALIVLTVGVLFGVQGPRLLDRFTGPPAVQTLALSLPTATTTSPAVASDRTQAPTFTPSPTEQVALPPNGETPVPVVIPPTSTPTATATPTWTVDPPTPTPQPPTATATPTQTWTVTPTPTETPTPTPGPNPTLVACLAAVDESLRGYVSALDPAQWTMLGCPSGDALLGTGERQGFERGRMIGFDNTADMFVIYGDDGAWEREFVIETGEPPPDLEAPDEGLYIPHGRFAQLWGQENRWQTLGFALAPEPERFPVTVQSFQGAVLIADRGANTVLMLRNENQR
ncbi:MAG: serine/threonine protein kinase [Caldilineaceae bacterium]|nr:serine/threonine protein kinase [Caldilineaceae bacterium]